MDSSCIITLGLRFTADVLSLVIKTNQRRNSSFNFQKLKSFDGDYIEERWNDRFEDLSLYNAASLFSALGWFAFCVPILQVSWLLSKGGKIRIAQHLIIAMLVVGGSICELVSSLMLIGITGTSFWISQELSLDNWFESNDGSSDKIGWKVLELVDLVVGGMLMWVNALEWFCLFGIMTLIFINVRIEHKNLREGSETFGKNWALLGLVIGICAFLDFISDIMRLTNWRAYTEISLIITSVNLLILFPTWIFLLGKKIGPLKQSLENSLVIDLPSRSTNDTTEVN